MLRLLIALCLVPSAFGLGLVNGVSRGVLVAAEYKRTFAEIAQADGYLSDTHTVTTKDGYILTIFNITSKHCCHLKSIPVLLMHGLLLSADSFLDVGKDGYPYLLADDCFNVFVGNYRGNYYGRAHTTLNPDTDPEFWHFSTDEMGKYDVPAQIDYVLEQTQAQKLNYIGFSQGGGTVLMTCSEMPEYNDKIEVIIALSPAARMFNSVSPLLVLLLESAFLLRDFLNTVGIEEILFRGTPLQALLEFICKLNIPLNATEPVIYAACDGFLNLLDPLHIGGIDDDTIKKVYKHFPAGTSIRTAARYGQGLRSNDFPKYDYGPKENLAKYNSVIPPNYNISKVTAPVVITYAEKDTLVAVLDILWLKELLPNVIDFVKVADKSWVHLDTVYNRKLRTLIYPTVSDWIS